MMASVVVIVSILAIFGNSVTASPQPIFPEDLEAVSRSPQRIVSGWEANLGQIPHQLSLRMVSNVGGVSACGGSIIHPEWGLTAAHCTANRPTIVIRAGLVNLTRPHYIFETTQWHNHPQYIDALQGVVQPNDIAILKFPRRLVFTDNVKSIKLQSSTDMFKNYDGVQLIASGWGLTWTNGASPENLNWVYLLGVSNAYCMVAYNFSPIIVDSTICANGYNVTSQSTCQGDSGGPLSVVDKDGILSQIGVTSFVSSSGCHTPIPAGFVRTGPYHDWYREVTGINFDTSRPDPTTEAPEVTTEAPDSSEETTESPESSEETTEAPEVTTEAPESSEEATDAPESSEETTEAPEVTTEAPEVTTEAPEVTTEAPESSEEATDAPKSSEETTEAPEVTTEAPESSEEATDAPKSSEEATEVPEVTTEAPESAEKTTEPPEFSEETSEVTTELSESSEETIEITTEAPEETSESSDESSESNAKTSESSAESSESNSKTSESSAESSESNSKTSESSDETTEINENNESSEVRVEKVETEETLWSLMRSSNIFNFMY